MTSTNDTVAAEDVTIRTQMSVGSSASTPENRQTSESGRTSPGEGALPPGFSDGTAAEVTAERSALRAYLQAQRDSVLAIVAGLDEAAWRTAVVPSGWTPLSLVEHLGHAERFWAQVVLAGGVAPLPWSPEKEPRDVSAVIAFYRDQAARTDAIVGRLRLSDRPPVVLRDDLPTSVRDVRDVVLHLVEETARHAGHVDIARELLDGRTGLGPR
jgi:uncharacterized damage-inducible protein DinB